MTKPPCLFCGKTYGETTQEHIIFNCMKYHLAPLRTREKGLCTMLKNN